MITAPERRLGVDARTTDFDHSCAQRLQRRQVEFAFAVVAAGTPGGVGQQHTVGADDHAALAHGAHDQMFAVRIETVDIVAGRRTGRHLQPRTELTGEHIVAQALRGAHLLVGARPDHLEARRRGACRRGHGGDKGLRRKRLHEGGGCGCDGPSWPGPVSCA